MTPIDRSTWPEPAILIARNNAGETWQHMANVFGCSRNAVLKYAGIARAESIDAESRRHDVVAMDQAFCAAMSAAIKSGLEWAPIGIAPVPVDSVLRKIIRAPAMYSLCGSQSAMCADVSDLSR